MSTHPAQDMLEAFASVGAERFDLTTTDLAGRKVSFHPGCGLAELRPILPAIIADATDQQHNVIVRPRGPVIQLDDLDEAAVEKLRPVSFLILRTSQGNHQAWVAVADADEDFARRLRRGTGADLTASGATRVSGSTNFKEKYAPAFPRVETVHTSPGKAVTSAELEALGVVAPVEKVIPLAARPHRSPRGWPSYRQCLEGAPEKEPGRHDRSLADYTWCVIALRWGWGVDEIAGRLMQESDKAQENGPAYALRTARAAARVVKGRGSPTR